MQFRQHIHILRWQRLFHEHHVQIFKGSAQPHAGLQVKASVAIHGDTQLRAGGLAGGQEEFANAPEDGRVEILGFLPSQADGPPLVTPFVAYC